jgi:hypothetical protein
MAGTQREWTIGAIVDENGDLLGPDQDQLLEVMQDIAGTLRAVGGMFAVTAERMEVREGEGRTVGYIARWQAFSPMRKQAREDEPMPHEQEPVDVPEPVEA